jgi:hypothetical protein
MTGNKKAIFVILMLVAITVVMSSIVSAKQGPPEPGRHRITLERHSSELKPGAPKSTFGRPGFLLKDSCSGSCDCSSCSCSGSFDCCLGGCMACWDYRDRGGLCGAQ